MKILYGIQGTGHGHISRAREILPSLKKYGSVDVMISGYASKLDLDENIVHKKRGISLIYDRQGRVSIYETFRQLRMFEFWKDVLSLDLNGYDIVFSDFEPVASWAARRQEVPCVGISHQAAFISEKTPRPKKVSSSKELILKYFAPSSTAMGIHFKRYDDFVYPPIIRSQIRNLSSGSGNHITVYLPAFHDEVLVNFLKPYDQKVWEIFSPHCTEPYQKGHIHFFPVSNDRFLESIAGAEGIMSSAGFETCSETMFLGKKLIAVPIGGQYEQLCNAAALEDMGVTVIYDLNAPGAGKKIERWLDDDDIVKLTEIADVPQMIDDLLGGGMSALLNEKPPVGRAIPA